MHLRRVVPAALVLASASALSAQSPDPTVIRAIQEEGLERSQAMETVSWLSDVYGPRVTGTPAIEAAGEWAATRLRDWGLEVSEERFAYGRGWSLERFHAHMVAPQVMPIIGYPRAWTSSTDGTVTAEVVRVDVTSRAALERHRGTLAGKVVLTQPAREVRLLDGDLVLRMDGRLLAEAARPHDGLSRQAGSGGSGRRLEDEVHAFFLEEGVVAILDRGSDLSMVGGAPLGSDLVWPTQRTDGGTLFVGAGGSFRANAGDVVPSATIAVEHYNRMIRVLEKGLPVRVEINIQTRFHEEARPNGFNLLAELPGTDLAHEVVILGAHFDSTHAGTGATDNAAGVAAMMEAVRILRAVGVRPRRTIRVALWGGEEEGLLGSLEYVRRHYADRRTMVLQAGSRAGLGVLQPGQRRRSHPRHLAAGQRRRGPLLPRVDARSRRSRRHDHRPAVDARHGPSLVRRGWPAGLPVHPGSSRVQLAHAPLEHGRLRPRAARRPAADVGGRGGLRLQHRDARRAVAAQATAGGRVVARPLTPGSPPGPYALRGVRGSLRGRVRQRVQPRSGARE